QVLATHGDAINAIHAQLIAARRLLLLGHVAQAEETLAGCELRHAPPMLAATRALVSADIALPRSRARAAHESLGRARPGAQHAGTPALPIEVEQAPRALDVPAARRIAAGETHLLRLEEVEDVLGSGSLVVDGCRRTVRDTRRIVALARRPVLFGIARALA